MRQHESAGVRWSFGSSLVSRCRPRRITRTPACSLPRVLIVDDDALLREGVQRALRGLCETIGLSSGAGLEEFVENTSPDLLILDVALPGRDGFELCRSLRSRSAWRSLPVIFLTGRGGDGPFERCLAVQGDAFLTKPFSRDELAETVIRLLPPEGDLESKNR